MGRYRNQWKRSTEIYLSYYTFSSHWSTEAGMKNILTSRSFPFYHSIKLSVVTRAHHWRSPFPQPRPSLVGSACSPTLWEHKASDSVKRPRRSYPSVIYDCVMWRWPDLDVGREWDGARHSSGDGDTLLPPGMVPTLPAHFYIFTYSTLTCPNKFKQYLSF